MKETELFEPGEYLQSSGRPGYFSVLAKPYGKAHQDSFDLSILPAVIESLDPDHDTWITQAVFNGPNRRAVNLRDVGVLFVDLDTYQSKGLIDKTPEELTALLLIYCSQEGIPEPSIVLFSGRGLQAKWLLSEVVDPVGLLEWNQAQLALVKLLEPFAADRASKDVSRVLRLDHTVNTKSGEKCRVVHVTGGVEGCPARYDFQEMREILVGEVIATAPREEKRKAANRPILALPAEMHFQRVNWLRLYDIRELWKLRGGVPEGYREITLFWELNFLLRADPGRSIWQEAQSLAAQIGKSWFDREVRRSTLSTLYRKAQEAKSGIKVEYRGREYPPFYTPRNQTLIGLFQITSDEERNLLTIISQTEKVRRQRERRWMEGVKPQSESITQTRPWEDIGISRAWWYRRFYDGK